MRVNYVIRWKSKVNGRAGKGTKTFTGGEAEQLATELNQEYPQIEHEPFELGDGPEATSGGPALGDEQHASAGEADGSFSSRPLELVAS